MTKPLQNSHVLQNCLDQCALHETCILRMSPQEIAPVPHHSHQGSMKLCQRPAAGVLQGQAAGIDTVYWIAPDISMRCPWGTSCRCYAWGCQSLALLHVVSRSRHESASLTPSGFVNK